MLPMVTGAVDSLQAFLDADHARLNALWTECRTLWPAKPLEAKHLFYRFKADLERHITWEDDLVFPAYERLAGRPPDSLTALLSWEHRYLRRHLQQLERLSTAPPHGVPLEWVVFNGLLSGHNQREERRLYPLIDQMLSRKARCELLEIMRSWASGEDSENTGRALPFRPL